MPVKPNEPSPRARRGWPPSSLFFLGLSAVLAVLAVLLWVGAIRIGPGTPPPPPPTPGQLNTIDVVRALEAQGLAVEQPPPTGVVRGAFSAPAQILLVDGEPLYLFRFPDPATAEREVAAAEPSEVLPASTQPTPGRIDLPAPDGSPPMIVRGSNVAVALPGGDDDLRDRVRTAIEGLP
jgi:hypothetical protein